MQDRRPKQNRLTLYFLGLFVLILLSALVLLQSSNLWKGFSVDSASDTLLLYALSSLNFIAFVIFGFIFLRSIVKLAKERRTLQLGAKIKTRLLLYFAAVCLLPILAMAGFSYLFMNRALERWFTQIPENVVRKALEVQTEAVADQARELDETTRMLASALEREPLTDQSLKRIADTGNVTVVGVLAADGTRLSWIESRLNADQKQLLDETLNTIRAGEVLPPSLNDGRGYDAATAPMSDGRTLLIVPSVRESGTDRAVFDDSLIEFDRLKDKQATVRQVGFLTLGVLTFLIIFASSWTAFYVARGLTVPIRALAVGADEIAKGNLSHRVDVLAEDELEILVDSFNQMSSKLEENSAALSEGRRYIETILQSLPTGVIAFDPQNRVRTINRSAIAILTIEDTNRADLTLDDLVTEENRAVFERLISRAKRIGHAAEQTILKRQIGNNTDSSDSSIPVALIATALPNAGGAVLVIEDMSELIAAQRASAWQEVARRMAHEIKNPLTPIQLSAERIAKKFGVGAPAVVSSTADSINRNQTNNVIKEGTDIILREVQSLKAMVDEFSRFARLPDAILKTEQINEIIGQVRLMYLDRFADIEIEFNLSPEIPETSLDAEQIKRVLVNLIENSIESIDDRSELPRVEIKTRHDRARDLIIIDVSDNGRGIDPANFQKLFQPYFSTKGRGTGLGLAIVRRIIAEHNGKIWAAANRPAGTRFTIEIPVTGGTE